HSRHVLVASTEAAPKMLPIYVMTLPMPIYETAAVLVAAFMALAARTLCTGAKDRPVAVSRMIGADDHHTRRQRGARSLQVLDDRSWEVAMSLAERASLHAAIAQEMKALRSKPASTAIGIHQHLQQEFPRNGQDELLRGTVSDADVQAYAAGFE
ncbi:unnamed protein product, partial [Cladocopium goreaui]